MAGLRAYALGVAELRAVVGATGPAAERLRAIAAQAFPPGGAASAVPDRLGPIYRRVPGAPVVRPEDPTRRDLDALLAGTPILPRRAAPVWRLVEAFAAGLAWSSSPAPEDARLTSLLGPAGLDLPPLEGLVAGWCRLDDAAVVPALHDWLETSQAWTEAAGRAGRPRPDVVVLGLP
ncbi:hypothetical protein [Microlunatus antarcticus]|uniref:Uncharacterized protein n=1 Tax=Microlunatus antarcticus TaxID=53388 RepID=A0A7W5P5Q9_9ACTN|nr:hypothetical protein [Microlunatus antarcticus]MBB3325552.1 hypothetical protein [Microlunatus antarcticus]